MADGDIELSAETARLAAIGRGEIDPAAAPAEPADPAAAEPPAKGQETPPAPQVAERPADVPEKFWDAAKGQVRTDALLKSYLELEKVKGQQPPADGPPAGDPPAGDPAEAALPAELFSSARDEWAQSGELGADTREKIIAAGIDEATLDTYLAGVKALSAALDQEVFNLAGGEDQYKAATEWARQNWSQEQINRYNAALNDPALREVTVKGLLAVAPEYTPVGEGTLTIPQGGSTASDVYTDKDEFLKDLAAADGANDQLARRKAVQKLERSKKAGSLAHVTPRTGLKALR